MQTEPVRHPLQPTPISAGLPFHMLAKPIGPICNLDCSYCFYLEKEALYPGKSNWRMPADVLEQFIRQYIEGQNTQEIGFAWQGGEPTLLGVDFFERVVELQAKYANGKNISNGLQTNGTLLDDRWCQFLAKHQFLIGLSIDGPRELHDVYRVDKKQQPTFDSVVRGVRLLQKHGVAFNTLTVVHRKNSQHPTEVYRFLKQLGSQYHQYIPLVERQPIATLLTIQGQSLAGPPIAGEPAEPSPVTPWSVEPRQFGEFLVEIFDQWLQRDVGRIFVQLFDTTLGMFLGIPSALCVFKETCGQALALEHNGDVYSCDHYVYPEYRLGNVTEASLAELVASPAQQKFGRDKADTLPQYCRECDVRFACNGECPKHRFMKTPTGEPGLNYLCAAYKRFFHHAAPAMREMGRLLRSGRPATEIMQAPTIGPDRATGSNRNQPCPCGSGKKFKACCGR